MLSYLAVGIALLVAFVVIESRHRHPLVPLRLFRSRNLTGANLIMIFVGSVMFSLFFFLSQYLQEVHGYSPLRTGFAFLPMPLAIIIGTQISSRLVGRVGSRALLTIGLSISAVGMLLLSRLHAGQQLPAARRACRARSSRSASACPSSRSRCRRRRAWTGATPAWPPA